MFQSALFQWRRSSLLTLLHLPQPRALFGLCEIVSRLPTNTCSILNHVSSFLLPTHPVKFLLPLGLSAGGKMVRWKGVGGKQSVPQSSIRRAQSVFFPRTPPDSFASLQKTPEEECPYPSWGFLLGGKTISCGEAETRELVSLGQQKGALGWGRGSRLSSRSSSLEHRDLKQVLPEQKQRGGNTERESPFRCDSQ